VIAGNDGIADRQAGTALSEGEGDVGEIGTEIGTLIRFEKIGQIKAPLRKGCGCAGGKQKDMLAISA
jgi:hypothetical protein